MLVDDIELFVGTNEIGSLLSLKGTTCISHRTCFPVFLQTHPIALESDEAKSFQQPLFSLSVTDPQQWPDIEVVVF